MNQAAILKTQRVCMLRSVAVNSRRLIYYASYRDVLNIPATPDDPLTITVSEAARRSGLSTRTIDRMIARGRDADTEA
jgi:hypothetical protein